MLVSLLFLASHALGPIAAVPAPAEDPPIRVWFNAKGNYGFADRARVYVKAAEAGHAIVLRADAAGKVRVLFPLDPTDDQRIAAGRKYELKDRGGREAFIADDTGGHGVVLAAVSSSPFRTERFARDGHWDLRALADRQGSGDPEAVLRDLVRELKPAGEPIVYAVATYVVSERYARARYPNPYPDWWGYHPWWGYRSRLGVGYWRWYRPWY